MKILRGRPFDSEGEAWHFWSGQIIYFHHARALPENVFPGKPRTEYLFSTASNL